MTFDVIDNKPIIRERKITLYNSRTNLIKRK